MLLVLLAVAICLADLFWAATNLNRASAGRALPTAAGPVCAARMFVRQVHAVRGGTPHFPQHAQGSMPHRCASRVSEGQKGASLHLCLRESQSELVCQPVQTLFKHYTGSTWHGSDASTLKWVFRERLPLLAFVAAAAAALTGLAVSRGWLVAWAGGSSSTLGSKAH
jgi:hypothetical protein